MHLSFDNVLGWVWNFAPCNRARTVPALLAVSEISEAELTPKALKNLIPNLLAQ